MYKEQRSQNLKATQEPPSSSSSAAQEPSSISSPGSFALVTPSQKSRVDSDAGMHASVEVEFQPMIEEDSSF